MVRLRGVKGLSTYLQKLDSNILRAKLVKLFNKWRFKKLTGLVSDHNILNVGERHEDGDWC